MNGAIKVKHKIGKKTCQHRVWYAVSVATLRKNTKQYGFYQKKKTECDKIESLGFFILNTWGFFFS